MANYRKNWRPSWYGELEATEKKMVERIAYKYDMAWRSGYTSAEGLWQNPYCEGMIEVLAEMGDASEWGIRRAIAEYCLEHGLMCGAEQRPEWMAGHMDYVREAWVKADAQHNKEKNPLQESRRKLQEWLRGNGFEVYADHEKPTKRWRLKDKFGKWLYIELTSHKDGRQAEYVLCNEAWSPIQ